MPTRDVTDAAINGDGAHVAVRTYSQVFIFESDTATGRIRTDVPSVTCNLALLMEQQGEAIAWRGSSGLLVLLSEGEHAPLHVARCASGN